MPRYLLPAYTPEQDTRILNVKNAGELNELASEFNRTSGALRCRRHYLVDVKGMVPTAQYDRGRSGPKSSGRRKAPRETVQPVQGKGFKAESFHVVTERWSDSKRGSEPKQVADKEELRRRFARPAWFEEDLEKMAY
jgi:hypothetical protein